MSTQAQEYSCPYCPRKSASPGGVRFHVKLTHPDKLEEFNIKHLPKLAAQFKELNPET
ncbi:MAG: hypothetical protein Q8O47_02330 [Candidatus Bathyarchaeota archaeon]|nr:hypothetical protein [Candidatus Bathyarchaeota archaeon]